MNNNVEESAFPLTTPSPPPTFFSRFFLSCLNFIKKKPALSIVVIIPNIVFAIYLTCIASPQYISEAHFMVKSERSQGTPLSMLLQAGGETITSENTYAVQDYMMSRDAMNVLLKNHDLEKVFNSPTADFMARYPNWYSLNNKESFYRYYKKHVKAEIDADTSLSVLRVRTFSAAESQRIAKALLAASENLVNDINARQRQNLIGAAQKEVDESLKQLKKLQIQMATFRDTTAMIDPEKQSVPLIGNKYALQAMLTATQMQLEQTLKTAPDSPAVAVYRHQISIILQEIKNASATLTGNNQSLVPKLTEFDSLTIQRQLLEKVLISEVGSLEAAKAQANRQMVFLEDVTQPDAPDYPEYPPTIVFMAVCLAATYGLYTMGRLLVAGAREHKIT